MCDYCLHENCREFRPLIQYIRDRDTSQFFEVLDGMKLKDGYLYKKVSISSLMFWGLMPSEEELLKFEPNKKEDSDCQEWLSELYGEQEEKRINKNEIGGSKGEGSSTCTFEVHDPVLFKYVHFLHLLHQKFQPVNITYYFVSL